jgi:hypothetical protein
MKILGTIIIAVILIAIFLFFKYKKWEKDPFGVINAKDIDLLGMEDILPFFKKPETLEALKKNENLIAVVIKELKEDGIFYILACIYDKKNNTVVDLEKASGWKAKKLDDRLAQAFGDKSMIILT